VLLIALCAAALAQDVDELSMPELNVQAFRPSLDSQATLWTDDAALHPGGRGSLRLAANWAHNPLVVVWNDGSRTSLVRDTVNLDLLAGLTIHRFRAGVDLPLYLLSTSDLDAGGGGLGDLAFDLRGGVLAEEEGAPLGLAIGARLSLPTATLDTALGSPGLGGELGLIASKHLGDLLLAANLGTRFVPETQLVNVQVDDQVYYRVGGGYALGDAAGLSLDLAGHLNYNEPFGNPAANPHEGLLGGWLRLGDAIVLRAGGARGLTRGIASPDLRLVGMLGWEPRLDRDLDGDGLVDRLDACPEQPEDIDGWEDQDGCADPTSQLAVRVVDREGYIVTSASFEVRGPQGARGPAQAELALHPGHYRINASAPGWAGAPAEIDLALGQDQEIALALVPLPALVRLRLQGPDGEPVDGTVSVEGGEPRSTRGGQLDTELDHGGYNLTVRVDGMAVENHHVQLQPGASELVQLQLRRTQVALQADRIEINGEVYFDTDQVSIKVESFPLLDEVAQLLADHPEVQGLRIEGHTDSRGDDAYNLQLSKDRAAAVLSYLVSRGVTPDRLESQGFGETRPLDKRENEAAWGMNRRVDFFIAERGEVAPAAE
jgi:outer membrane protein OmpA-like peptidoglycan-associated protein